MFRCYCGCGRMIIPADTFPTRMTRAEAIAAYQNGEHRLPTPSGQERTATLAAPTAPALLAPAA